MSNWFSKNLWLKLVALVLAVITWFYAREELGNAPGYRAEKAAFTQETPASAIPQK